MELSAATQTELARSGWTPHAIDVIDRACAQHGGLGVWRRLRTVRLIPERLSGLVPWLKGAGRSFPIPAAFEVAPHERVARFTGYPDPEHVGIFQDGAVRIERADDNAVIVESNAHRGSFRGLAKYRQWSAIDALYFFGYALTHYHSLPFSLLEARLIRSAASGTGRAPLDVLDVELPASLPTHSRVQRFYFDPEGRITRHDYHAEIIGYWARGAHFWNRQVRFAGFPVSLERHVFARAGTKLCPLTALRATFLGAEVDIE